MNWTSGQPSDEQGRHGFLTDSQLMNENRVWALGEPAHGDCSTSGDLVNSNTTNKSVARHYAPLSKQTPSVVLPERSNPSLIEPSEPAAIFKEIQGTEECMELRHECAISNIQMVGSARGQTQDTKQRN